MANMGMNFPLFLDITVIIVLGITIVFGIIKGFFPALIQFLGQIIAIIVGGYLSRGVSSFIYEKIIRENLITTIVDSFPNLTEILNVQGITSALKESFSEFSFFSTESMWQSLETFFSGIESEAFNSMQDLAEIIVDKAVQPILIAIMTMFIFTIIYSIISILVKIISKWLENISEVPVIGKIDKTLGGVLGLIRGIIWIFLICIMMALIIDFSSTGKYFNITNIESTHIFKYFYNMNPFNLIS